MRHNNVCIILEYLDLSVLERGCQGDLALLVISSLKGMGYPYEMADTYLSKAHNYSSSTNLKYRWNSLLTQEQAEKKGVPCRGYSSLKVLYMSNGGSALNLTGRAEEDNEYLEFEKEGYESTASSYTEQPVEETSKYELFFSPTELPSQPLASDIQTIMFLRLLFNDEDQINFSPNCINSQLVDLPSCLENAQEFNDEAIHFMNCNACTGNGNANVADFKYTLVESDCMTLEEQYGYLLESKLPITTIVYSGGKSLHALVKIEASSSEEYASEVRILHEYLLDTGFDVDAQCKDPSRYTRVAGVMRDDKLQSLVAHSLGLGSFAEWKSHIGYDDSTTRNVESTSPVPKERPKSPISFTVNSIPISKEKGEDKLMRKAISNMRGTVAYKFLMEME